jgi:hypothetical protein
LGGGGGGAGGNGSTPAGGSGGGTGGLSYNLTNYFNSGTESFAPGGGGGNGGTGGTTGGGAGGADSSGITGTVPGAGAGGSSAYTASTKAAVSSQAGIVKIRYPYDMSAMGVSFSGSSISTTVSTTQITGAAAGDILVLFDWSYQSSSPSAAPTEVVPAGWTKIAGASSATTFGARLTVSYRQITTTNTIFTGQSGTTNRKILMAYRPNFTVSSIQLIGTPLCTASDANQATQVSTRANLYGPTTPRYICLAGYFANGTISLRTSNTTANREINNSTNAYVKSWDNSGAQVDSPIPTNTNISSGDYGTNALTSCTLAIL